MAEKLCELKKKNGGGSSSSTVLNPGEYMGVTWGDVGKRKGTISGNSISISNAYWGHLINVHNYTVANPPNSCNWIKFNNYDDAVMGSGTNIDVSGFEYLLIMTVSQGSITFS